MSANPAPPTILLPLDGSEAAERAAGMAAAMARHLGGRLLLIGIPEVYGLDAAWYAEAAHDPSADLVPVAELLAEAHRGIEAYLMDRAAALSATGLPTTSVVVEDLPWRAIVSTAREHEARMIVMATHGWGALSRWAFGSVADKVLHTATRPVLLVRAGATHLDPKLDSLLVAVDGSDRSALAIAEAREIATATGAHVLLVHVIEEPLLAAETARLAAAQAVYRRHMEEHLADHVAALRESGLDADYEILAGDDVAGAILEKSEAAETDLLCITTHGRGGFERWALGSVADRVIRDAFAPVLVRRIVEAPA